MSIFAENNPSVPEITDEEFAEGFGANCDNDGLLKLTKNSINGVLKRLSASLGLDDFNVFLCPIIAGIQNSLALPVFDVANETLTFKSGTIFMNRGTAITLTSGTDNLVVDLSTVPSAGKLIYLNITDRTFLVRNPAEALTTTQVANHLLVAAARVDEDNESDLAITCGYTTPEVAENTTVEETLELKATGGTVLGTATGYFEKIGNRILFDVHFDTLAQNGASTSENVVLEGLPFLPAREVRLAVQHINSSAPQGPNNGSDDENMILIGIFSANSDVVPFNYYNFANGVSPMFVAAVGASTEFWISGSYPVAPPA